MVEQTASIRAEADMYEQEKEHGGKWFILTVLEREAKIFSSPLKFQNEFRVGWWKAWERQA